MQEYLGQLDGGSLFMAAISFMLLLSYASQFPKTDHFAKEGFLFSIYSSTIALLADLLSYAVLAGIIYGITYLSTTAGLLSVFVLWRVLYTDLQRSARGTSAV